MKIKEDVRGNPLPESLTKPKSEGGNDGLYIDGYIWNIAQTLNERVEKDWDGVFWTVGGEGNGKSAFAQQLGLALNADFNLKHIVFNVEELREAIENAEPFDYIQYDEGDQGTGNRGTSLDGELKRLAKTIRDKNLFINIVTPVFFDRNKYFAITRTLMLFHVYSVNLERGYVRVFDKQDKKHLYMDGKKYWNMRARRATLGERSFIRFTDIPEGFPVSQDEYKDKKHESLKESLPDKGKSAKEIRRSYRRECLDRLDRKLEEKFEDSLTNKEYGFVFDVDGSTVSRDFSKL
jgi:hypothetical protein